MVLNIYRNISNQYIKPESVLSNNIIEFENDYWKKELLLLLEDNSSELNKNLLLNNTSYQVRLSKRSNSCSTKNGNLGI